MERRGRERAAAIKSLIDVLDAETEAVLRGQVPVPHASVKEALLSEIEGMASDGSIEADARQDVRRLRDAALRNRTALETSRRAALALIDELRPRLAAIESDGTYRRSDLAAEPEGQRLLPKDAG